MLEAGRTLAHYEIIRLLGKGGMGEVYVARDQKLGRKVALKVLPEDLASERERRARFEREARAVAALKHPNIVTLHSIEEADGLTFLVMELVEGKPLSEAIPAGGFSLGGFLEIAIPLTDAVAAAHAQEITHRDLKPENVLVDADGRAQVLDFGLAKVGANAVLGANSIRPTEALTGEGRVMGTVAYMSPEQVEGRDIDPRSDIFSLGVVFYEMLTGTRPFEGDTSMSVLTSILRDEPVPVTELKQRLPRFLGRIVRRCLQKDPSRRFQSALDLRNDLKDLEDEMASGELAATPVAATTGTSVRRRLPWALLAVTVASALVWWVTQQADGGRTDPAGASIETRRLVVQGSPVGAVISPDGRYVAYTSYEAGQNSLRLQQVASGSDIELAHGGEYDWFQGLAFTADSEFLRYLRGPGNDAKTLWEIPVFGGTPRRLTDGIAVGPAFSPDGTRFAFVPGEQLAERFKSLELFSIQERTTRAILELPEDQSEIVQVAWSPEGDRLALAVAEGSRDGVRATVLDLADPQLVPPSGEPFQFISGICWSPDGESLIVIGPELGRSQGQPWQIDLRSEPRRRLVSDFNDYVGCSTTADGRLTATIRSEQRSQIWVVPVDEPKAAKPLPTTTGRTVRSVTWLDRETLVYSAPDGGARNLWQVDADKGGRGARLTSGGAGYFDLDASDTARLVFDASPGGVIPGIFTLDPGAASQRRLSPDGQPAAAPAISPDGRWIFYQSMIDERVRVVGALLEDGEPRVIPEPRAHEPSISPDGTRVAIHVYRDEVERWQTAIYPIEGDAPERVLDVHSQRYSPWASDDEIYILRSVDGIQNLYRVQLDDLSEKQATFFTGGDLFYFDVSPDLERLAVVQGETFNDLVLVEGLLGSGDQ